LEIEKSRRVSAAEQPKKQPKRVFLVDAVVWSEAYPESHPLKDVARWYRRWLADLDGVELRRLPAEADLLSAVGQGTDALIISGSPRDAWNGDPINGKLCDLVLACRDRGLPVLGVCYGHQILARALGGVVARHPGGLELGNVEVELTGPGRASPLFEGLPDRFEVLSSHADTVLELSGECQLTLRGGFTPIQGFQCQPGLFGVQFHPETDPDTLRFIWSRRRDTWRPKVAFNLDTTLDTLRPTPWAGQILRNFVTHIVK